MLNRLETLAHGCCTRLIAVVMEFLAVCWCFNAAAREVHKVLCWCTFIAVHDWVPRHISHVIFTVKLCALNF